MLRTGAGLPSAIIDRPPRSCTSSWEDAHFTGAGFNQAVISIAIDGGPTWVGASGGQHLDPSAAVAINSAGTVANYADFSCTSKRTAKSLLERDSVRALGVMSEPGLVDVRMLSVNLKKGAGCIIWCRERQDGWVP